MSTPEQPRDVGHLWYEVVTNDTLRQGDLLLSLLIAWLPDDLRVEGEESASHFAGVDLQYERGDWIILSASCDIQPGRKGASQQQVLLAKVYPCSPDHLANVKNDKELRVRVEVLRRGLDLQRFLLAHSTEPRFPLSFVAYRTQLTVPIAYVRRCCSKPRLRLRSPHRESFGNWAGANLARVGIEDDAQIRYEKGGALFPEQVLRANSEE